MIRVTKTFLPPLDEYTRLLERVWQSYHLTNRGPLLLELEQKLTSWLGVHQMLITTNGTLPIQIAIRALDISGEVITTPFSYVATTSSLLWERCKPVFVDIHPDYLTIDERAIESAITENTQAILATHVFGNPCHVDAIADIARKYNLKVIYDAAHAFGVTYNGQSLFNYGDVSTCSFHATKIFHTGEGGALFTADQKLYDKLFYMHNFGHDGPHDFQGIGINAKTSELQAAMGLALLPYLEKIFSERKRVTTQYREELHGQHLRLLQIRPGTEWNDCYFPVIFESEDVVLKVIAALEKENIQPRRYFYPSLNRLRFLVYQNMPVSESVSQRILCLPLYPDLSESDVSRICRIINQTMNG
jgi:dTDP-4-amino-4,6-dideoxygalactose transaminase